MHIGKKLCSKKFMFPSYKNCSYSYAWNLYFQAKRIVIDMLETVSIDILEDGNRLNIMWLNVVYISFTPPLCKRIFFTPPKTTYIFQLPHHFLSGHHPGHK